MKTKKISAGRKSSAGDLNVSPLPQLSTTSRQLFDFDLSSFSTSSKKKSNPATSSLIHTTSSPPHKAPATIADLKNFVSPRTDSIKRHLDRSHSEILKDFEASHSRLSKRFKIQTHACQQMMDEAEKEYKKMSDRISESMEVMKASYTEFMAEAQASASRVSKTSISELTQSFEKSIKSLQSRYGIPSSST